MNYHASCDWIKRGGKTRFRWYIGDHAGNILLTAKNHKVLVRRLRRWMKQHNVDRFTIRWDNDDTVKTYYNPARCNVNDDKVFRARDHWGHDNRGEFPLNPAAVDHVFAEHDTLSSDLGPGGPGPVVDPIPDVGGVPSVEPPLDRSSIGRRWAWFGIVVTFALLVGCMPPVSRTRGTSYHIRTIEHDNHKWVLVNNAGVLHHPDCPCQGKAER